LNWDSVVAGGGGGDTAAAGAAASAAGAADADAGVGGSVLEDPWIVVGAVDARIGGDNAGLLGVDIGWSGTSDTYVCAQRVTGLNGRLPRPDPCFSYDHVNRNQYDAGIPPVC
jgi:hypothetical protein